MPHVINANDRNQAFIKFIAFFTITIILIVCAVYVDFRGLPQKKKQLLDEQFAKHRTESREQEKFVQQMEKAWILIDSLDRSGKNRPQVEATLEGKLTSMENLKQRDTTLNGKLDDAVLSSFLELQRLKKEIEKFREMPAKVIELQQKLAEAESSLDLYRSQPQQIPGQQNN